MKRLAAVVCLGLAGCLTPATPWQERGRDVEMGGGPSDTTHLLRLDPAAVESGGPASLAIWAGELERRYVRDVEVDGIVWQPFRSSAAVAEPDLYGTGGDSMLFTGIALAGWAWKYAATRDADRLIEAIRGLWILTHVAGRGVLCRAAFPAARADTGPAHRASARTRGDLGRSDRAGHRSRALRAAADPWSRRSCRTSSTRCACTDGGSGMRAGATIRRPTPSTACCGWPC